MLQCMLVKTDKRSKYKCVCVCVDNFKCVLTTIRLNAIENELKETKSNISS